LSKRGAKSKANRAAKRAQQQARTEETSTLPVKTHKTSRDASAHAPRSSGANKLHPTNELHSESELQAATTTVFSNRAFTTAIVLAIIVLAFVIRIYKIVDVPHGFFCDEASIGLDGYSLAHTLRDKDGQGTLLPTYLEGLGQWRGALYTYFAAPFIGLLGMSEFSVRLVAAVMGTLTVWLTFLFASKAVNRTVGLLSALLLAISPWHIINSRAGWDVISLPFMIALFLTFFYQGLERPNRLILACACAALGEYVYFAGRLFFPVFCFACLVIYAKPLWEQRRMMAIGLVVAVIMLIPTMIAIKDGVFFQRVNELNGSSNGLQTMLANFGKNYLQQYKPEFLLNTTVDWNTRQFVRDWGMIYLVEVPFLLIGLAAMFVRRSRLDWLCLVWFIIYPVANALVSEPNSTRAIGGVLVYQLVIAQGIYLCLLGIQKLLNKWDSPRPYRLALSGSVGTLIIAVLLFYCGRYMQDYLYEYPKYSSGFYGWQWGFREVWAYFRAHHDEYDDLMVDSEFNAPYELQRFYSWPEPTGTGSCAKCSICETWVWWAPQQSLDESFRKTYHPTLRQLWAVGQQSFELVKARNIPYRIVNQLNYPDASPAFYFLATGPGV